MIFSATKTEAEPANSLLRVIQQILEACALHAVEFDTEEHALFRKSIREIAERFSQVHDYKDLLVLSGEANTTIQTYHRLVEKFIREITSEKRLAVDLLAKSLLRVCNSSEQSAQNLRQIGNDLGNASQLQDMRVLRAKLTECVGTLCQEAEIHEAQYVELRQRISQAREPVDPRDQITGLCTLRDAESRIKEMAGPGRHAFAIVFFLKNVEVVNRRFDLAPATRF